MKVGIIFGIFLLCAPSFLLCSKQNAKAGFLLNTIFKKMKRIDQEKVVTNENESNKVDGEIRSTNKDSKNLIIGEEGKDVMIGEVKSPELDIDQAKPEPNTKEPIGDQLQIRNKRQIRNGRQASQSGPSQNIEVSLNANCPKEVRIGIVAQCGCTWAGALSDGQPVWFDSDGKKISQFHDQLSSYMRFVIREPYKYSRFYCRLYSQNEVKLIREYKVMAIPSSHYLSSTKTGTTATNFFIVLGVVIIFFSIVTLGLGYKTKRERDAILVEYRESVSKIRSGKNGMRRSSGSGGRKSSMGSHGSRRS